MQYDWDWGLLFEAPYFSWLLTGLVWTLLIASAAWVIAFSVGSIVGILRTTDNNVLRMLGSAYVEIFRGVPLLVQFFLWYYVLPIVVPEAAGEWLMRGMPAPVYWTSVVALGLYTAARVAEQVRAGIESLAPDLNKAGLAIGLTPIQCYRYIRLPVSYRIIIPPLTTEFLTIFKNSSLALTIGMMELTAQAYRIESITYHGFEAFTAATVLYLVITLIVAGAMRIVDRRTHIGGALG